MAEQNTNQQSQPSAPTGAAPTATVQEVVEASRKGSVVKVLMPEGVSSVNVNGVGESVVDEDGTIMCHVKHALHLVESFGGRILSSAKPKPFAGANPGRPGGGGIGSGGSR